MNRTWYTTAAAVAIVAATPVLAHDDSSGSPHLTIDEVIAGEGTLERPSPSDSLAHHDASVLSLAGSGYVTDIQKNLAEAGRGERLLPNGTTDVWAHDGYAFLGTFNSPCGDGTGDNGSGVQIYNAQNPTRPVLVNVIPTPTGSRANDVKVASMSSGTILVHSNESCGGGPGGIEIYNLDNPLAPVKMSSVRFDEINPISNALFGGIFDVGVHNMWLWQNGGRDYVSVVAESAFDNFRTLDITDPANPVTVGTWGAEEIFDPGVGEETSDVGRVLGAALDLLGGFGASQNKFLHDITVNEDGTRAYLSNWDAGLVLLDISDPADPVLMSVAIDPIMGSYDMEVNSHNAWMNADGTVVVETEEDFSAWEGNTPPSNLTMDGTATPGDPTIPGTAIATNTGNFFEANQTGLNGTVDGTSVSVDGGDTYPAVEFATAAGSPTFADTGPVSGNLVWVGRACGLSTADVLENPLAAGDIAVVRRGACEFDEKAQTVAAAGAAAIVIANNQASTPWSGIRIWDFSDEVNPVLLSTFDTPCSLSLEPGGACDPRGTYSVHNVQVEGDKAYASWYTDGMVILDISDPANPVEIGRYDMSGPEFEEQNGGIQDIWGIYKEPGKPWVYGSDRNGGLYILKEYGTGSAKVAKN
jgi:hypothetical protein